MIRNPYDIYGEKRFPLDDDVYCSLSYSDVNPNPTAVDYIPASLLSSISGGAGPATSGGNRHYIDPWDLENFAYLQRRHGSESETVGATEYSSEDCESTSSSMFLYKRGGDAEEYYGPVKYKYNNSPGIPIPDPGDVYGLPCNGSGRCRPEYCLYSGKTDYDSRVHLPPQPPQLKFPPPPYEDYSSEAYDPYDLDNYSDANTLMECQECSLSLDNGHEEDIYYSMNTPSRTHFSLSKRGLLQIDYSCNWNCLDNLFKIK